MCEYQVMSRDNHSSNPTKEHLELKTGMVITVQEDGHKWSALELAGNWIFKRPGVSREAGQDWVEEGCEYLGVFMGTDEAEKMGAKIEQISNRTPRKIAFDKTKMTVRMQLELADNKIVEISKAEHDTMQESSKILRARD